MAYIEVDHSVLRNVASAITTYCTAQDNEMERADVEVRAMLASDWLGQDAHEFGSKWINVNTNDSTSVKFRENLKNFKDAVSACAKEYQSAQETIYNQANRLPKVLYW